MRNKFLSVLKDISWGFISLHSWKKLNYSLSNSPLKLGTRKRASWKPAQCVHRDGLSGHWNSCWPQELPVSICSSSLTAPHGQGRELCLCICWHFKFLLWSSSKAFRIDSHFLEGQHRQGFLSDKIPTSPRLIAISHSIGLSCICSHHKKLTP